MFRLYLWLSWWLVRSGGFGLTHGVGMKGGKDRSLVDEPQNQR